jgi:DNA-binding response OmpR family regulator
VSLRVLVIEDDERIGALLMRGLRLAGHRPEVAGNRASGKAAWTAQRFDLVILDVMLPDGDGLELLADRRAGGDTTPVLILSAREESELRDRAIAAGATASLSKPFAYHDLLAMVERLAPGRVADRS